nr:basic leucine zipper 61-like [Tanacetum cinerariifolium]
MMGDDSIRRSSAPRNGNGGGNAAEFDRFDEEQFMSMFIDDETANGPTNGLNINVDDDEGIEECTLVVSFLIQGFASENGDDGTAKFRECVRDLNNLESTLRARAKLKSKKEYKPRMCVMLQERMPHFSKDKNGVQFDPRQRTLFNFIKAKDNKKQIVNEEHSTYFRNGYKAHGCSHIDPSSDHLSELQQNICMSIDDIEEAIEHHRSEVPGVIRKAPQDIRCKGKYALPVPETNTIIGSSSIISEHDSPVAVSQNSTPTSKPQHLA